MAGERLYSEFKDNEGDVWRVSIYDTNATWDAANKTAFTLGSDGFVLQYSGNNEQQHDPVIGSSVQFVLFEQVAAHTQTLDLLYSFPEGRLLLDIYRDPDGDNTLYWRGVILAEQVERNDEPMPTAVSLTASDDLGNLKDIDFSLTAGDVGSSGLFIYKHILRCLAGLRTYSRFASGEPILRYINDTELSSTEDDPNPLAEIIGTVPVTVDNDGNTEAHNSFDILSSLATCFNARVFLSEGVFWFWPINAHKRLSDGTNIGAAGIRQYDKAAGYVAWTTADSNAMNAAAVQNSGTDYKKLAGHVFTHLPPVRSVQRTRRFNGNQYLLRGNDDTIITAGQNVTLADTDETYEVGTKFRISGSLEFQVSPDSSYEFNAPDARVHIEVELKINADAKYYQPEEWTTDSADRYVIDVRTFDRNRGTNTVTAFSFVTDALPSEEDGLDVTAVAKFFNESGTNVTSAYTSDDFYLDVGVEIVDDNGGNADIKTYRATHTSENVLEVDQGEVLFGDNIAFSAQGKLRHLVPLVENNWKSSQTAGPLPIHRLGVNEALSRQKFATKIHRGTVVGLIEMWHTLEEDSDYYVPFDLTTVMNMRETTIERFKIAYDSSGITSADDPPRADDRQRGGQNDLINGVLNTVTAQVQQPKLTAGTNPATPTGGRSIAMSDTQGPITHRVISITHQSAVDYTFGDADTYAFVYMNAWTGGNGFSRLYLPKVGDNEGRMLRFKSDGTIGANTYYRITVNLDDYANGTRIDGQGYFQMDRSYDGITIMCHDNDWYVIQRKEK
jgi:hypothetical protein